MNSMVIERECMGKYTIEQILDAIAQANKETVQVAGTKQWTGGKNGIQRTESWR